MIWILTLIVFCSLPIVTHLLDDYIEGVLTIIGFALLAAGSYAIASIILYAVTGKGWW